MDPGPPDRAFTGHEDYVVDMVSPADSAVPFDDAIATPPAVAADTSCGAIGFATADLASVRPSTSS